VSLAFVFVVIVGRLRIHSRKGVAFGIWIAAGTIGGSSPLAWALMGLLIVMVGSISLYQAIRDLKIA